MRSLTPIKSLVRQLLCAAIALALISVAANPRLALLAAVTSVAVPLTRASAGTLVALGLLAAVASLALVQPSPIRVKHADGGDDRANSSLARPGATPPVSGSPAAGRGGR